jgi:hypothetical protein
MHFLAPTCSLCFLPSSSKSKGKTVPPLYILPFVSCLAPFVLAWCATQGRSVYRNTSSLEAYRLLMVGGFSVALR